MVDALPCDIGDVQKAVDTAEIDERAVIGDVLDDALRIWPSLRLATSSVRASARLSSRTARRETTMLPRARSILRIWNGCGVPISGVISRTGRISTWLPGKKCHRAAQIDRKAAFDAAEDHAGHMRAFVEGFLQDSPAFLALGFFAGQHRFAIAVFHAFEEHFDRIACFQFRRNAAHHEFAQGDAAFGFQADIDQDEIIFDGDDRPLMTLPSRRPAVPKDSSSIAAKLPLGAGWVLAAQGADFERVFGVARFWVARVDISFSLSNRCGARLREPDIPPAFALLPAL